LTKDLFKRVLITGTNGMLGKDIAAVLIDKDDFEVFGVNRVKDSCLEENHSVLCDITDFSKLNNILNEIKPNIIINCAANVNVDECEKNREYAYKLNAEATRVLAAYNQRDTKFVYISSDSVFDGETGYYKEEDRTSPLNYYAWSKLEGENLALKENKNSIILRTNIYGLHKSKGNSLVEWALKNLQDNKEISGFDDVLFNPVYTKQLARIVRELLNINFKGILHTGCRDAVSKYRFLLRLAEKFNIDPSYVRRSSIESITFNARRPKKTNLNIDKLSSILNLQFSLEDGLTELFNDYNKQH
jgi:dTDP-4-dehydrorhamnose reductase